MMLARPPRRRDDEGEDCGCERHPRLRIVLWLLWLAAALGLAIFTGHGLAREPAAVTVGATPAAGGRELTRDDPGRLRRETDGASVSMRRGAPGRR